jgi:hypothetical protein
MVTRQAGRAHGKLKQMLKTFTYRNRNFLDIYQSIFRSSLLYGFTTWRPTTLKGDRDPGESSKESHKSLHSPEEGHLHSQVQGSQNTDHR